MMPFSSIACFSKDGDRATTTVTAMATVIDTMFARMLRGISADMRGGHKM